MWRCKMLSVAISYNQTTGRCVPLQWLIFLHAWNQREIFVPFTIQCFHLWVRQLLPKCHLNLIKKKKKKQKLPLLFEKSLTELNIPYLRKKCLSTLSICVMYSLLSLNTKEAYNINRVQINATYTAVTFSSVNFTVCVLDTAWKLKGITICAVLMGTLEYGIQMYSQLLSMHSHSLSCISESFCLDSPHLLISMLSERK